MKNMMDSIFRSRDETMHASTKAIIQKEEDLRRIGQELTGIYYEDLTRAEKNIFNFLQEKEIVGVKEDEDGEQVVCLIE